MCGDLVFGNTRRQTCSNTGGELADQHRIEFMLSGFKSHYVTEWQTIYETIAMMVYSVYGHRHKLASEQNMDRNVSI